ncbi:hypothetical protein C2E23DRAFT_807573 [Lenzites betulinus]|nr:hypothetical protein C2E23DRAFT_807573 [Lenzites betulinus]
MPVQHIVACSVCRSLACPLSLPAVHAALPGCPMASNNAVSTPASSLCDPSTGEACLLGGSRGQSWTAVRAITNNGLRDGSGRSALGIQTTQRGLCGRAGCGIRVRLRRRRHFLLVIPHITCIILQVPWGATQGTRMDHVAALAIAWGRRHAH